MTTHIPCATRFCRWVQQVLPIATHLKGYDLAALGRDAVGGLTVTAMLVPKGMAYALLAGLPPIFGLYASFIPTIIAALTSSSRFLATAPNSTATLLTVSVLMGAGLTTGSPEWITATAILAVLVGLVVIAVGAFRFGFLVELISNSVVQGFTIAVALITIMSQAGNLLGLHLVSTTHMWDILVDIFHKIPEINYYTLGVGLAALAGLLISKKLSPYFPGALVVLALATIASYYFDFQSMGIAIIKDIPAGFPSFGIAGWSLADFASWETIQKHFDLVQTLGQGALIIAFFGLIEPISIAKFFSLKEREKWDPDREMVSQGLANTAAGFFSGLPVFGSLSCTVLNYDLKIKTPIASVLIGVFVGLTLLFFAPLFYYLPKAVLTAIVIVAVGGLIKPAEIVHLWRLSRIDGWIAIAMVVLPFFLDLGTSITIGIGLAIATYLHYSMRPRTIELAREPEGEHFVNAEKGVKVQCPQILMLKQKRSIFFGSAQFVYENVLNAFRDHPGAMRPKFVMLDMSAVSYIDATAADMLTRLASDLASSGARLAFTHVSSQVLPVLQAAEVFETVGEKLVFSGRGGFLGHALPQLDHKFCSKCKESYFKECPELKKAGK